MHESIVFPIARTCSPETNPVDSGARDLTELQSVNYRLRDAHLSLHGTLAGQDRVGVYALLDRIVGEAVRVGVTVHCVAPTGATTPAVEKIADRVCRGPMVLDRATARYRKTLARRHVGKPPLLIVLDYAELVLADGRADSWRRIALLGAASNVSILAVAESLSGNTLLGDWARGNLFHFRSLIAGDRAAAETHLPGVRVDLIQAPNGYSLGWASNPSGYPTPFVVEAQHT